MYNVFYYFQSLPLCNKRLAADVFNSYAVFWLMNVERTCNFWSVIDVIHLSQNLVLVLREAYTSKRVIWDKLNTHKKLFLSSTWINTVYFSLVFSSCSRPLWFAPSFLFAFAQTSADNVELPPWGSAETFITATQENSYNHSHTETKKNPKPKTRWVMIILAMVFCPLPTREVRKKTT